MSACRFCGLPGGRLRVAHASCQAKRDQARRKIPEFFLQALAEGIDPARFKGLADGIAASHFIKPEEYRELAIIGITAMIGEALDDNTITRNDLRIIAAFMAAYGITVEDPLFARSAYKLKRCRFREVQSMFSAAA